MHSLLQQPEPWGCSVVIPFFNEAQNVAPLLEEVRRAMDALGVDYEVVCVNDGSTDATAAELARVEKAWARCRVLTLPRNHGQAAALLTGIGGARGAVLITMDGDGQNDPADIARLLAVLERCDMAVGVRAQREDSRLRRMMSRTANRVRGRFLGDGVSDTGCALKAFRREVAGAFLPIRTLYSFMPALAVAAGFRVAEQPVRHRPRVAGISKYGLRAMLWRPLLDMLGVWWFTRRRVQIAGARAPQASASDARESHPDLFDPPVVSSRRTATLAHH